MEKNCCLLKTFNRPKKINLEVIKKELEQGQRKFFLCEIAPGIISILPLNPKKKKNEFSSEITEARMISLDQVMSLLLFEEQRIVNTKFVKELLCSM